MRKLLSLLLVLLTLFSAASADSQLLRYASDVDLAETPLAVTLSIQLTEHSPFDETRTIMLNQVLSQLALCIYAGNDQSSVAITMGNEDLLTLSQEGSEAQISCMPGMTYTASENDVLSLLLGSDVSADTAAIDGTYEQWLKDGWTLSTSLLEPLVDYGKRKSTKTTIKNMGVASSCTDYTIPKSKTDDFKEILLSLCPEGDLHNLLASLIFSGKQTIRIYRAQDETPLRLEYNGVCGLEGDLRTVKFVWRTKREEDETRDEITLTSPANSGSNKNTLSFTRVMTFSNKTITAKGEYSYKVTANKQTRQTDATFDLTNKISGESESISGSVVLKTKAAGSDTTITETFTPDLAFSTASETLTGSGTLHYQRKGEVGVTEDCTIAMTVGAADHFPWESNTTATDLSSLSEDTLQSLQAQVSGAVATAIVRPLIQVLSAEDAAFFFYEMAEEDVREIQQEAGKEVIVE